MKLLLRVVVVFFAVVALVSVYAVFFLPGFYHGPRVNGQNFAQTCGMDYNAMIVAVPNTGSVHTVCADIDAGDFLFEQQKDLPGDWSTMTSAIVIPLKESFVNYAHIELYCDDVCILTILDSRGKTLAMAEGGLDWFYGEYDLESTPAWLLIELSDTGGNAAVHFRLALDQKENLEVRP